MDPGWESVRGSRTDAYRQVWCEVYAFPPGRVVTIAAIARELGRRYHRHSVRKALNLASACGLLARMKSGGRVVYVRKRLPDRLSIAWLMQKPNSASLHTAANVLRALESGNYIEPCVGGYRPKH